MIPLMRCYFIEASISLTGTRTLYYDTILELADNATYINLRYAPAISGMAQQQATVGDRMPPIEDQLTLDIVADTPGLAYAAWTRIMDRLDQAATWSAGKTDRVIELHVQLERSTTIWMTRVSGPPDGEPPSAPSTERTISEGRERYVIRDITISFVRGARWLALDTPLTVSDAANTTVPWRAFMLFSNEASALSPYRLSVTWPAHYTTSANELHEIYIITKDQLPENAAIDGSVCNTGVTTGFTLVNDAAHLAPGGNVLRYSPSGLKTSNPVFVSQYSTPVAAPTAQAFLAVRPNNFYSAFMVGLHVRQIASPNIITTYDTPLLYVSGYDLLHGNERPRILAFPPMPVGNGIWDISVRVVEATTPAVGSLDIAYIVVVLPGSSESHVTCVRTRSSSGLSFRSLIVIPDALSASTGRVVAERTAPSANTFSVAGVGSTDRMVGNRYLVVSAFGTQQDKWVIHDVNTTTPMYPTIDAMAYSARRIPE